MQQSTAESFNGSFLQYYNAALSSHLSLYIYLSSVKGVQLTEVLLYVSRVIKPMVRQLLSQVSRYGILV